MCVRAIILHTRQMTSGVKSLQIRNLYKSYLVAAASSGSHQHDRCLATSEHAPSESAARERVKWALVGGLFLCTRFQKASESKMRFYEF